MTVKRIVFLVIGLLFAVCCFCSSECSSCGGSPFLLDTPGVKGSGIDWDFYPGSFCRMVIRFVAQKRTTVRGEVESLTKH